MLITEFFQSYISEAVTAFIGAFFGWFFARKKQAVEVQASTLENVATTLEIYNKIVEDLKCELFDCREYTRDLEENRKTLKKEITSLKRGTGVKRTRKKEVQVSESQ